MAELEELLELKNKTIIIKTKQKIKTKIYPSSNVNKSYIFMIWAILTSQILCNIMNVLWNMVLSIMNESKIIHRDIWNRIGVLELFTSWSENPYLATMGENPLKWGLLLFDWIDSCRTADLMIVFLVSEFKDSFNPFGLNNATTRTQ